MVAGPAVAGDAPAAEEAPAAAPAEEAAPAVSGSVSGMGVGIKHGKLVIAIKEGKDIYIELPI